MGYDISYHPVDVQFIHQQVLPCVTGEGDVEQLANRIAKLAALRYRANAWGLAMLKACPPPKVEPVQKKRGVFSRFFGKAEEHTPEATQNLPRQFESDLYVWGRPFFITGETPSEVSAAINRYMEADLGTVDDIARDMVRAFDSTLLDKVKPDMSGNPPTSVAIRDDVRSQFEQLGNAWKNCGTGKKVLTPDGEPMAAEEFLGHFLPLTIFGLAANFRPGWMARGYVWPTELLRNAGLAANEFFEPPTSIFDPLIGRVPEIGKLLEPTITGNYAIGGFVPAGKVNLLGEYLSTNRERILQPAAKKGWADEAALCLRKIDEALKDASVRGIAFAEASEVYSASMGVMN